MKHRDRHFGTISVDLSTWVGKRDAPMWVRIQDVTLANDASLITGGSAWSLHTHTKIKNAQFGLSCATWERHKGPSVLRVMLCRWKIRNASENTYSVVWRRPQTPSSPELPLSLTEDQTLSPDLKWSPAHCAVTATANDRVRGCQDGTCPVRTCSKFESASIYNNI